MVKVRVGVGVAVYSPSPTDLLDKTIVRILKTVLFWRIGSIDIGMNPQACIGIGKNV